MVWRRCCLTEVNRSREPELHRLVSSPGTILSLRHYAAASAAAARRVVVLVHGLVASADIFDIPGLPGLSLARSLAGRGFEVVTYDQRGSGGSTARSVDFGLREHAWIDLPAVLRFALELTGTGPDALVLGGHSLGGVLLYLQQIAARSGGEGLFGPAVGRAFTLASPALFDPSWWPWNRLRRGGHAFVADLDVDGDGMVSRDEFVAGQSRLRCPAVGRLVRPWMIGAAIRAGSLLPWIGGLLRFAPLPTYIYGRRDFSNWGFWRLLRSRALDRAPRRLFYELVDATADGGRLRLTTDDHAAVLPADLSALANLKLLTVSSRRDHFVPWQSVRAVASYLPEAEYVLTEERFGRSSGHAGYLFRPGLAPRLQELVADFAGR